MGWEQFSDELAGNKAVLMVLYLADFDKELQKIKERNARVEVDKAWETSIARRGILAVATYFAVLLFLYIIRAPNPELAALVPALAYVLQTLTLPFLKGMWIKKAYKR